MSQPRKPPDEPRLFDLPLDAEKTGPRPRSPLEETGVDQPQPEELSLFPETEETAQSSEDLAASPEPSSDGRPTARRAAPLPARCLAGLIDLGILLAVALTLALGSHWLGVDLAWQDWPALLVVGLSFSFLYLVPPLAFWGRTPGMARAGLVARNRDDQPLTFRQTVLRWLGAVLTLAACGLPLLLSITGASLSDRLSCSLTYQRE